MNNYDNIISFFIGLFLAYLFYQTNKDQTIIIQSNQPAKYSSHLYNCGNGCNNK